MNGNDEHHQNDGISDNPLEVSVVDSLVKRYEEKKSTSYLASSQDIVDESDEYISAQQMYDIFNEKSKYYASIKMVKTSLKHVEVYISPRLARQMLELSQRGAVNKKTKTESLAEQK
ncbi:hypothetical protein PDPUS_2_00734 [Photobacterium damselae subsp. piscicida]|uniref:Uncharacterized protein n=1 Tax=Photobacterium damsela subsp. piscicida TaxID=38294 RepID=A0AAD1CKJ6_PHODP|nr:hypothetical protein PDPUS_2_00734 [Photobacterium damselae subsp. piscicida]GAW46291.1 hypothetical protein PDPJ_2_00541 [Photobacterium damselae subsp. piscicida]